MTAIITLGCYHRC